MFTILAVVIIATVLAWGLAEGAKISELAVICGFFAIMVLV